METLNSTIMTPVTTNTYTVGAEIKATLTGCVYVVPRSPVTGAELISHASRYPAEFATKSDLVAASGHVRQDGKLNFTSFYEALLEAKTTADPNYLVTVQAARDEDKEYDDLSESLKELYDAVHERFGRNWTHSTILGFLEELDDLGIAKLSTLEDAFYSQMEHPGYRWEREFAEEYANSMEYGLQDSMIYSSIDWQDVWDHNLRYDFNSIEFDDSVFIFLCNY